MSPRDRATAHFRPMPWVATLLGLLVLAAVGAQLQHLAWSTARVKNESPHVLSEIRLHVDDATVAVGVLRPGRARLVRLPDRGDATFSVEFVALDRVYRHCREYVEGDMYHVRATVSPTLGVSCTVELGVLTSRLMLLEYW